MANRFFPNYEGYKITSPFGMRTLKGVTKLHKGIDLVARDSGGGSAVDMVAAHTGGTVAASGYDKSCGNFIKIATAPGVVMVYYHLQDTPALQAGDPVITGQILGCMGASGDVTGAHLHWGIQADGQWIDPEPWLDRDYVPQTCLPTLRRGDKTEAVRALQALLILRGCDCGVHGTDGSFGPATQAALEKYCGQAVCTEQTWMSLLGL